MLYIHIALRISFYITCCIILYNFKETLDFFQERLGKAKESCMVSKARIEPCVFVMTSLKCNHFNTTVRVSRGSYIYPRIFHCLSLRSLFMCKKYRR